MSRIRRVTAVPGTNEWLWQVTDALNQLPAFTMFDGNPNTSGIAADYGTIGINVESGGTQRVWVNASGTTNSWSWLSYI